MATADAWNLPGFVAYNVDGIPVYRSQEVRKVKLVVCPFRAVLVPPNVDSGVLERILHEGLEEAFEGPDLRPRTLEDWVLEERWGRVRMIDEGGWIER